MRPCARPARGEPRRADRGRDHLGQRGHHHGGYVRAPVAHGVCFPTRPAGEDLTDVAGQQRLGGAAGRAPWRPLCGSATTSRPGATSGPPFPCPAPGSERSVSVTACFWSDRLHGALARDHVARALVAAGAERAAGRRHLRHGLTDGLLAPTRRDVCGSVGGVRGQQSVHRNGEVPWILHNLAAAAGQRLPAHSMPAAQGAAARSRRPSHFATVRRRPSCGRCARMPACADASAVRIAGLRAKAASTPAEPPQRADSRRDPAHFDELGT